MVFSAASLWPTALRQNRRACVRPWFSASAGSFIISPPPPSEHPAQHSPLSLGPCGTYSFRPRLDNSAYCPVYQTGSMIAFGCTDTPGKSIVLVDRIAVHRYVLFWVNRGGGGPTLSCPRPAMSDLGCTFSSRLVCTRTILCRFLPRFGSGCTLGEPRAYRVGAQPALR